MPMILMKKISISKCSPHLTILIPFIDELIDNEELDDKSGAHGNLLCEFDS